MQPIRPSASCLHCQDTGKNVCIPRSNDENMGKLADEGRESPSMVPRLGTEKRAAYEAAAMQPTRNCLRAKAR
jgi:hypothetical protein